MVLHSLGEQKASQSCLAFFHHQNACHSWHVSREFRGVARGGVWGAWNLADQLTLFKPRGADYVRHTTASPPGFKIISTPLTSVTCHSWLQNSKVSILLRVFKTDFAIKDLYFKEYVPQKSPNNI